MSEFNNRIAAQRKILSEVNGAMKLHEELCGLSAGAIERWMRANSLDERNSVIELLKQAAAKLFFLSNKSQEQVTDEYLFLSQEVAHLTEQIRAAVARSLRVC